MNRKSIHPGKVKPLILLFWLAISSTAALASCNHTPTSSSSPTATTSPSAGHTTQGTKVAKAEAALKSLYTDQVGLAIESITCPQDANFKAGSIFECQAIAQDVKFGIEIKVENNQGRFDSKVKGKLLNLSKVEELLQKAFKDKAKLDVIADCGGKRRVSKVGDIFTCKVTDKQGKIRNAQVTVKDEKGNFNVKI
jgi:hypothetical protein